MTIDFAATLAKLKQLETQSEGFVKTLLAEIQSVENNTTLNGLLAAVNPAFANAEQSTLKELEKVLTVVTTVEGEIDAKILPFLEQLATSGSSLLPYITELISLFSSLQPAKAA